MKNQNNQRPKAILLATVATLSTFGALTSAFAQNGSGAPCRARAPRVCEDKKQSRTGAIIAARAKQHLNCDAGDETEFYDNGMGFMGQKKYAEAEAEFRKSIQTDPRYKEAWQALADALRAEGKTAQADAAQKMADVAPDARAGAAPPLTAAQKQALGEAAKGGTPTNCGADAPAKAIKPTPAAPVKSPTKAIKLPPLAPKAGFIIGRALYEDGRPIEDFSVMASGQLYGQGNAEGKHGYYELPMQKGLLITHIVARGHVSYRNNPWLLDLQPTQPIPFASEPWDYNGTADKGIVRDFVLKIDGPQPGYSAQNTVEYSLGDDAHSYRYGGNISVGCANGAGAFDTGLLGAFPGSQIILTLTPTADPRIDNSVGTAPIVREFPIAVSVNVYGIPIGLYQATARLREANGALHDLRLSSANPYGGGDWTATWLPTATVEWKKPTYAGSNPDSPMLYLVK